MTVLTALKIAEKILRRKFCAGFQTPAKCYGADLILEIEGELLPKSVYAVCAETGVAPEIKQALITAINKNLLFLIFRPSRQSYNHKDEIFSVCCS
jgi:hypothetical protein